jgi:spore maturation protein CgeB
MKHRLNISFFGSSLVSAHWNGAATYYRGLIRALAERGHRVTFYEPDAYERQQHRDIPEPNWARVVVYPATDEEALDALERAEESDLIIKCSGVGIFDELLEAAVLELKRPDSRVAFLDMEAPATLDRIRHDPEDSFRPLISEYDFILTSGGGAPVVEAYLAAGAAECVPIYNALDPHTHFPVPADARFEGDLGLLENRMPDQDARVDEFFFGPAAKMPGGKFILGGNGWQDRPRPGNVNYVGDVDTREHNAFNSTPRAVLHVSRDCAARQGFLPATRVFEAAGAGACLITDKWEGIELFLEPGREVLVAENGEEVVEHLRQLSPERAREIGRAARARVLAAHTYAHRAEQLEKVLAERARRVSV